MKYPRECWIIVSLLYCMLEFIPVSCKDDSYVTCYSVFKLYNTDTKVRLHSHDIKYGTGSGQQSVTGITLPEDVNSYWMVKGVVGGQCQRGDPIKCNDVIRLEHLTTKRNLHSHLFRSPLSGEQEISCYGNDGEGDSGDIWLIQCGNSHSKFWLKNEPVRLQHFDTHAYLASSKMTFGRPINGQYEIFGVEHNSHFGTSWKTMEGVFVHKSELMEQMKSHETIPVHTEL